MNMVFKRNGTLSAWGRGQRAGENSFPFSHSMLSALSLRVYGILKTIFITNGRANYHFLKLGN